MVPQPQASEVLHHQELFDHPDAWEDGVETNVCQKILFRFYLSIQQQQPTMTKTIFKYLNNSSFEILIPAWNNLIGGWHKSVPGFEPFGSSPKVSFY